MLAKERRKNEIKYVYPSNIIQKEVICFVRAMVTVSTSLCGLTARGLTNK